MTTTTAMTSTPKVIVAPTKVAVPKVLCEFIAQLAQEAIQARGRFTIALSGGSLPSFLAALVELDNNSISNKMQWSSWHVLLADERVVPLDSEDSNLGSLQAHFLSKVDIPPSQIYGISQTILSKERDCMETAASLIAIDYEQTLKNVLKGNDNSNDNDDNLMLDLAVLGFGPDGHTCSLFPGHALLQEMSLWVAPIMDSPKPPPYRITLTFPVLNHHTRHIVVCGAGPSKYDILHQVWAETNELVDDEEEKVGVGGGVGGVKILQGTLAQPPPFPCAMVTPLESLTWVADADALTGGQ